MKKRNYLQIIGILLICILFLIIAVACGGETNAEESATPSDTGSASQAAVDKSSTTEEPTIASTPTPTPYPFVLTIEEKVLVDQDGIKITLKSFNNDGALGPAVEVLVENNSDKGITIQTKNASVNGVMVESMFSCDVDAGKEANDEIILLASDLEIAGIVKIKEIDLYFTITDSETQDDIFDSEVLGLTTNLDEPFEQEYDDSGNEVLNQDGVRIIVQRKDIENSMWGADIYVYIENNTDEDLMIQTRDVSVNGFMIQPIFSCNIMAGKKAFDKITFLESDLDKNDVEDIEILELFFTIIDMHSWDSIIYSDIIEVTFEE